MVKCGDCLLVMRDLVDCSVDAVVTDPPYGLAFMNKKWDYDVPSKEVWKEVLRVLKPGAHLLSFGGTRTYHRMVVNVEDAGFEIRDQLQWIYGSGFPKSHDIGKKLETAKGVGTALKPANEPIVLARKPLEGTVAKNVSKWGVGGLNIDGTRIAADDGANRARPPRTPNAILGGGKGTNLTASEHNSQGRWPANVLLDEEAAAMLGEPSRFFYVAKTSKRERDLGLNGPEKSAAERTGRKEGSAGITAYAGAMGAAKNHHPTVKPVKLMEYLCTLITPPGGVILDPFMGSGSTGIAAKRLGYKFIGIEMDKDYCEIAEKRISHG